MQILRAPTLVAALVRVLRPALELLDWSGSMSKAATTPRPPDEFLQRVADNLCTRCNVQDGTHILVGVSGGSDSMALLFALAQLSRRHQLRLTVAHFNHRLRADATEDAHFVVERAGALGLEVCVSRWADPERGEDAARRARHAFLARTARQRDCDVIALAHQLEDQIETVLMRLARGTGLRGLAGMAWRRAGEVDIVRPLLDCRRAQLIEYLRAIAQPWREDPSNRDFTHMRNRIRHGLLPVVERMLGQRRLERAIDGLDDLRAVWELVQNEARLALAQAGPRAPLSARGRIEVCDVGALRRAPQVVRSAALQEWFEAAGCRDLQRSHLRAAADLVRNGQSGHQIVLPGRFVVRLEQRTLHLELPVPDTTPHAALPQREWTARPELPQPERTPRAELRQRERPGRMELPQQELTPRPGLPAAERTPQPARSKRESSAAASLERKTSKAVAARDAAVARPNELPARLGVEIATEPPDQATIVRECTRARAPEDLPTHFVAWLDAAAAAAQPWSVRAARPGDRVRLLGAPGARKLARIFQDNRIPQRLRRLWPVVTDAHGILWVPGIGIAERVRLRPDTREAARLTLRLTPGGRRVDTSPAQPTDPAPANARPWGG